MKNELYNNELIGMISILSVLDKSKKIKLTKALLILPFFSHEQTLKKLKSEKVKVRSMEEFITKHPSCFANYNERFYSLLLVSMNSIILLLKMDLVILKDDLIIRNQKNKFSYDKKNIGERAEEIVQASSKLAYILSDDVNNLYLQLKVKI